MKWYEEHKDLPTRVREAVLVYNDGDAEKAKELMHRLGSTQASVAMACGVNKSTLSAWLRGGPKSQARCAMTAGAAVMKWYEEHKDLPTPVREAVPKKSSWQDNYKPRHTQMNQQHRDTVAKRGGVQLPPPQAFHCNKIIVKSLVTCADGCKENRDLLPNMKGITAKCPTESTYQVLCDEQRCTDFEAKADADKKDCDSRTLVGNGSPKSKAERLVALRHLVRIECHRVMDIVSKCLNEAGLKHTLVGDWSAAAKDDMMRAHYRARFHDGLVSRFVFQGGGALLEGVADTERIVDAFKRGGLIANEIEPTSGLPAAGVSSEGGTWKLSALSLPPAGATWESEEIGDHTYLSGVSGCVLILGSDRNCCYRHSWESHDADTECAAHRDWLNPKRFNLVFSVDCTT